MGTSEIFWLVLVVMALGGGAAYILARGRAAAAETQRLDLAKLPPLGVGITSRGATPPVTSPPQGQRAEALEDLLGKLRQEIRGREGLPLIRLRVKTELGDRAIAWSFPGTAGADLDVPLATALLNERLGTIGLRLGGGGMFTSDSDGSCMVFWRVGTVQADIRDEIKRHIEQFEHLEGGAAADKAAELAQGDRYDLLVAWLRQGRYFGIPAKVLRKCGDDSTAGALIKFVREGKADVRERAAYALGPLGGEEAARALCEVLPHTSGDELMSVAGALGRLSSRESIDPLLQAIQRNTERHSLVSLVQAARQCGEDSRAFDVLVSHLGGAGKATFECLAALVDLHEPRAVPAVKELLGNAGDAEVVRVAKLYLKEHGVVLQPASIGRPMFAAGVSQEVKFLRKHSKGESRYEVYHAETADAARQFLLKKQVTSPCYYIVVETPEGNWGVDLKGLYLEKLMTWQLDLSKADIVGRTAEGLIFNTAQAAALGYADNFIHGVICGQCACEWLDGIRLDDKTVVRCPKCRAMNLVTPPPHHFWVRE